MVGKYTKIENADCTTLQVQACPGEMTHAELIAALDTMGDDAARFRWLLNNPETAIDVISLAAENGIGKIDTASRIRQSLDRARNVRPTSQHSETLTKTAAQRKKF